MLRFASANLGAINTYQQEGESCGMGVEKNHGQCRPDLECVFGAMELIGTCQVKSKHNNKLCFTSLLCVMFPLIIRKLNF